MKLIFLGPPGSGKGTQAKTVADLKGVKHVSMGDILREAIRTGTETGKLAEKYLKDGKLVPDEVVNELARQVIVANQEKGFLLDGYPRTVQQAKFVAGITQIDKVVYIDVPKSEIVKRLAGRLSCKNCGAVYNVSQKPPKIDNKCDVCGKDLYMRDDDKEETVAKRFEIYEKETFPLLEFYKDKVAKIDGVGALDKVFERIKSAL